MNKKDLYKNKGGFKLPNGYFDDVEERLIERWDSKIPKETGFSVPENYFETLSETLQNKVFSRQNQQGRMISLFRSKKYTYIATAIAACLIVLLYMKIYHTKATGWNDVALYELENYIAQGHSELNAYDYVTIFNDVDLNTLTLQGSEINSDELIDYLSDETILYDNGIIDNYD
ncbi:hypothetical protein [Ascidiimonas aurantiaca]|uniref:hypothetical protein n=1 Tax=Ascidiimonas aurantiaca TaxID=1685432 RepID=UPI0030EC982B